MSGRKRQLQLEKSEIHDTINGTQPNRQGWNLHDSEFEKKDHRHNHFHTITYDRCFRLFPENCRI